jgi:hypothetical protein
VMMPPNAGVQRPGCRALRGTGALQLEHSQGEPGSSRVRCNALLGAPVLVGPDVDESRKHAGGDQNGDSLIVRKLADTEAVLSPVIRAQDGVEQAGDGEDGSSGTKALEEWTQCRVACTWEESLPCGKEDVDRECAPKR